MRAVAESVIRITGQPSYLEEVRTVVESGIPLHLFAGERSRADWHVPQWVLERAASMTIQPGVGHVSHAWSVATELTTGSLNHSWTVQTETGGDVPHLWRVVEPKLVTLHGQDIQLPYGHLEKT